MPDIFDASKDTKSLKKGKTAVAEGLNITRTVERIARGKSHALAAFVPIPRHLRFATQEKAEKIILLTRRHPITNLPWMGMVVLMAVGPSLVLPILDLHLVPERFQLITVLLWYLFTFAVGFQKFLSWFYNVGIVTDERLVDINFPTLLYRDISQAKLDQVQDVSVKVGGYIRSLFDFGDVYIQTAGEVPEIKFEDVPHPAEVSEILNEELLAEEQEKLDGRAR